MALADYKLCDICRNKTFYDANLDYQEPDAEHNHYYWLPRVGDWSVICVDCAKENETRILKRGELEDLRAKLATVERERDDAINRYESLDLRNRRRNRAEELQALASNSQAKE